jgi:hypothetical protein
VSYSGLGIMTQDLLYKRLAKSTPLKVWVSINVGFPGNSWATAPASPLRRRFLPVQDIIIAEINVSGVGSQSQTATEYAVVKANILRGCNLMNKYIWD